MIIEGVYREEEQTGAGVVLEKHPSSGKHGETASGCAHRRGEEHESNLFMD